MISNLRFENEGDIIEEEKSTENGPTQESTKKTKPDNPFAEDKIEFVDISAKLNEDDKVAGCPFVSIKDSNGTKIMYDAAIHDFFDLLNDLGLLIAFYLENDAAYYQDDQFEDLDLQFEDNLYDNILTQKNIKVKISKFNHHFNYEYLVTKLLEYECQFQAEKSKLCNLIFSLSKQVADSGLIIEVFDYLTDLLSRRPHLDLNKYGFCNQNNAEWMQRANLKRDSEEPFRGEMTNLVTSFIDNYNLEIEYFKDLNQITEDIIGLQKDATIKVQTILKTFEAFQGKAMPESSFEEFKPEISGELICQILKQVENVGPSIYSSFLSPTFLDRNSFSSFIFDTHYKRQIEDYLEIPIKHGSDFSNILNDFMNGISSRYRFFVEQSARKLAISEIKAVILSVQDGLGIGDDLSIFEGDLPPSPSHCFSVMNTTFSFFKAQATTSKLQAFDNTEGINVIDKELFMQQMNRYYSFLINFSYNVSIREYLMAASQAAQIYKSQIAFIRPVLDSVNKQARFEKPEDIIDTQENILARFIDFGDSCPLGIQDIIMVGGS